MGVEDQNEGCHKAESPGISHNPFLRYLPCSALGLSEVFDFHRKSGTVHLPSPKALNSGTQKREGILRNGSHFGESCCSLQGKPRQYRVTVQIASTKSQLPFHTFKFGKIKPFTHGLLDLFYYRDPEIQEGNVPFMDETPCRRIVVLLRPPVSF